LWRCSAFDGIIDDYSTATPPFSLKGLNFLSGHQPLFYRPSFTVSMSKTAFWVSVSLLAILLHFGEQNRVALETFGSDLEDPGCLWRSY
jgi:hypothetical protein